MKFTETTLFTTLKWWRFKSLRHYNLSIRDWS